MQLKIDNSRLRRLIPGVIHEVKNESPLFDKILPWLNSAQKWLEDNFLGPDFVVPDTLYPLAEKIVVHKAFAEATPSLDVVLSPAGFAVISTDGRAPASKERIERLITSLNSFVDANVVTLLAELLKRENWRSGPVGQWWLATFIPDLSEAFRFRGTAPLLDTYSLMRSHALRFEQKAAENYLGVNTISMLRAAQFTSCEYDEVIRMIREAELRFITSHMGDTNTLCTEPHEVWHLIRPAIARFDYFPALKNAWMAEMGHRFAVEPFKNNIHGGYFF